MTYKKREYISEAWKRAKKRKTRKFIKEILIVIILILLGTWLGCYMQTVDFSFLFTF